MAYGKLSKTKNDDFYKRFHNREKEIKVLMECRLNIFK